MFETLIQLRERALVCTACDLSVRRTKVVFGEGDPLSPLVLVGEGPGDQEDKSGRPFVGRAGQMLDRALVDAGISRERVYICNTVKCRSCDWNGDRPTNRPPTPEETNTCRQWLIPQLAALAPKVILCIGAPSAKNLIKPNLKITVERGLFFPCEYARTAIATLHPAYIMRRSTQTDDGGYSLLVADIKKGWDAAVRLTAGSA